MKRCHRKIVNVILYALDNSIKWRTPPTDFPRWPTVYNHFTAWEDTGAG